LGQASKKKDETIKHEIPSVGTLTAASKAKMPVLLNAENFSIWSVVTVR